MGLIELLEDIIIVILLFFIVRWLVFRVLVSGRMTGNKYARGPDGKVWVQHPGGAWMSLEEHEKRQKRLRDNI